MGGQTNINTLTLEYLNLKAEHKCINLNKIVSKFVAKLLKYMMLFKDIHTFSSLDYRYASRITFYLVVIGNGIPKIR